MADIILDVDSTEVSRAVDELIRMGKAAKDTGKAFEQGFRLVAQWQEKFYAQQGRINAELEKAATKQNLANKSARESAAVFQEQERAIKANTVALNQMRMSYDRNYAVEQRTLKLKQLLRQEIANGNMTVREAGAQLLTYRKQLIAYNQVQMAATKASNRLGVVTQQAGYQVSDFIVQVQSGTNPFVAFSQQASQLAGVLPLVAGNLGITAATAISLSAALGIGIPLVGALGAAFWNFSKDADAGAEAADTAENRIKSLNRTLREYMDTKEAAASGLTLDQLFLRSFTSQNVGEIEGRIKGLRQEIEDLSKPVSAQQQVPQRPSGFGNIGFGPRPSQTRGTSIGIAPQTVQAAQNLVDVEEKRVALRKALGELELAYLPQKRLETKLAEEALLTEREQSRAINERVALLEAGIRYGEDSLEVKGLERKFDIQAFARDVASLDITEKKKLALIEMYRAQVDGQEKAIKTQKILNTLQSQSEMFVEGLNEAQDKARAKAEAHVKAVEALEKKYGEAAVDVLALAGIDLSSNINSAVLAAAKLAADLNISLIDAYKLQNADVSKGVMAAAAAAKELARDLGISLRSAMAMAGMISSRRTEDVFDPRDPRSQGQDFKSERLRRMMESGELYKDFPKDETKGGGAGGGQSQDFSSYMASLEKELELKNRLVGMTEEQKTSAQRYFDIEQKALDIIARKEGKLRDLTPAEEERIKKLVEEEAALRRVTEAEQRRKSMMETIEGHITNGFMAMIDGSSSVENAFKSMLRNILLDIYRQQVAEPAAKGIMGVVKKVFGFADGGAFSSGRVIPFANGGVVTGPTTFPMPGATGLMGEAGPEAIMPLKRGPNGKLGVEASGGQQVVVNQSFNFAANGDESVKKIIAQAAPQIAQMTQKQIMDSRRRGGQMKAAFS